MQERCPWKGLEPLCRADKYRPQEARYLLRNTQSLQQITCHNASAVTFRKERKILPRWWVTCMFGDSPYRSKSCR